MGMSTIAQLNPDEVQEFMNSCVSAYFRNTRASTLFEDFRQILSNSILTGKDTQNGEHLIDYSKPIVVAPSGMEMLEVLLPYQDEIEEIGEKYPDRQMEAIRDFTKEKLLQVCKTYNFNGQIPTVQAKKYDAKNKTWTLTDKRTPVWMNSTLKGINIRPGFLEGDRSKPFPVTLDDTGVHMKLGGNTGTGKSVTMHSIINTLLTEYPPWELRLILLDFKKVEFPKYVTMSQPPHIDIVGSTPDPEYVGSLFKFIEDEMNARSELFALLAVEKTETFRKTYGIVIPRMLMIIDEFEEMIRKLKASEDMGDKTATKAKSDIVGNMASIGALGRSAGSHMLVSSQNLNSLGMDSVFNHFALGCSLGSSSETSKFLIGNAAGATLSGHGNAMVNDKAGLADNEEFNRHYRVPFINTELEKLEDGSERSYFDLITTDYKELADRLGIENEIEYFNDSNLPNQSQLNKDIALAEEYFNRPPGLTGISLNLHKELAVKNIVVGNTLQYKKGEQLEYITLKRGGNENILCQADTNPNLVNIGQLLLKNFNRGESKDKFQHVVWGTDLELIRYLEPFIHKLPDCTIYEGLDFPQHVLDHVEDFKYKRSIRDSVMKEAQVGEDGRHFIQLPLTDLLESNLTVLYKSVEEYKKAYEEGGEDDPISKTMLRIGDGSKEEQVLQLFSHLFKQMDLPRFTDLYLDFSPIDFFEKILYPIINLVKDVEGAAPVLLDALDNDKPLTDLTFSVDAEEYLEEPKTLIVWWLGVEGMIGVDQYDQRLDGLRQQTEVDPTQGVHHILFTQTITLKSSKIINNPRHVISNSGSPDPMMRFNIEAPPIVFPNISHTRIAVFDGLNTQDRVIVKKYKNS